MEILIPGFIVVVVLVVMRNIAGEHYKEEIKKLNMEFSVIQEDLRDEEGDIRPFDDGRNCPLYAAAIRQLPQYKILLVSTYHIDFEDGTDFIRLREQFGAREYNDLIAGKNFTTTIELPE